MAYAIVVALSLLVGSGVFMVTLRLGRERPAAVGFDERIEVEPDAPDRVELDAGPGFTYLRVGTKGPSWRDRLQGFVGLLILLVAGIAALAFGIYQLGHLVNVTIERFLQK